MKKVLLFGFDALPEIMAAVSAVQRFGGEAVAVPRSDWGLTLDALARGQHGSAAAPAGGKMLVVCGMDAELDGLLAALRQAGITCPKAVLTPSNRGWTAGRLYRELERERRAMGGTR